ncbi:hypothetical protein OICFNHDK_2541 [Methylobacterium bullatum]|uniref:Uncharacterized protein n=2 Tax=Methylobacteriaceae TaxID=119045 RepID=A0A679KIN5_9HYPH|nr:hypothetical protein OICFNHDK_2541 [Methylobacterium bullatum]CAA2145184.1 hypothetical protein MBLL_04305 [Methylobacterium bullatum]
MLRPTLGDTLSDMSNVVPFSRPRAVPAPQISDVVAVADDLFAALELLQGVTHRAAAMGRPRREMELTVRNLREAVSAVERALDCIGEGDEAGQG